MLQVSSYADTVFTNIYAMKFALLHTSLKCSYYLRIKVQLYVTDEIIHVYQILTMPQREVLHTK
jgi:hypothetical protein